MATAPLEQLQSRGVERVEPFVPPPSALLALTEAHRALAEIITLSVSRRRLAKIAPRGDGHPVMVLPLSLIHI